MIRLARIQDIPDIVKLGKDLQNKKKLYVDVPLVEEDFSFWLLHCINSTSTEILCSYKKDKLNGILILCECNYPWNSSIKYGLDLLFLCKKDGLKLINAAKRIAKNRKWKSLVISTTTSNERADKFMNMVSTQIGGVYNVSS